ncbi:MAG: signal peptidase II, partial [Candidatus Limosilactobacillus intestinavium]
MIQKNNRSWWGYLTFIIVLIGVDQLVKWWVTVNVPKNGFKQFLPGIVALTNLRNNGAAWSLMEGKQWFFAVVSVIAIIALVYLMHRFSDQRW